MHCFDSSINRETRGTVASKRAMKTFMVFAMFGIFSAFDSSIALLDTCMYPPQPHSECGFYVDCVEVFHPCGPSGYALGYGYKYCQKFTSDETLDCVDSQGRDWVNSTLTCLQQSLVPVIESSPNEVSCRSIKLDAFDSHPTCYTGGGNDIPTDPSICFLSPHDIGCVLATIDAADLFSPLGIEQEIETGRICVAQLQAAGVCMASPSEDERVNNERCTYWNNKL